MGSLDRVDKEILKLLKENGRLSYRAIAHRMGKEGSTIRKRVKRLIDKRVIKRFTIEVNSESPTKDITAFITVIPFQRYSEEIKKQLINFDEVMESHFLAGRCGILLKANFRDKQSFNDFIKRVKGNPGVASVRSCLVTKRLT